MLHRNGAHHTLSVSVCAFVHFNMESWRAINVLSVCFHFQIHWQNDYFSFSRDWRIVQLNLSLHATQTTKNDDNANEATTLACQRRRQMCENICLCVWKSQIFRWKCGRIFFSPSTNPVYPVLCLSHFISSSFEINIPNHGASLLGMLMHVCMLIFICLLWLPQLTIQFTLGHTPNNMELHRMNLYISVYRRELDRRDRKRKKECEIAEIGIAESEIHTFHRKIASMYVSESQTQTSTALCLIFKWYSRVAHRKLDVLYR